MLQYFKTNEAAANDSRAMESKTISKNGASPKSHTSRGNFLIVGLLIFALCINFSATAQSKGSVGVNGLVGFYSDDVFGAGIGANLAFQAGKSIRFAGEFDYSFGAESVITYKFIDFSVYGHYLFTLPNGISIYPLVGFGVFNVKAEISLLGVTVSDSKSKGVFSLGGGFECLLFKTSNWIVRSELRLKLHGGNHFLIVPGIAYKF